MGQSRQSGLRRSVDPLQPRAPKARSVVPIDSWIRLMSRCSIKGVALGWMMGNWTTATANCLTVVLANPVTCEEPAVSARYARASWGGGLPAAGDLPTARESLRLLEMHGSGVCPGRRGRDHRCCRRPIPQTPADCSVHRHTASAGQLPVTCPAKSLAELEWREGNVAEAIRYLLGQPGELRPVRTPPWPSPASTMNGANRTWRKAFYSSFLTITAAGDQDLPEIVEARESLARLDG